MSCSSCAATVRGMLERTPGVARATVSLERAEAIVEFDPARVAPTDLVQVIERLGYRAQLEGTTDGRGRAKS
jgi:copper chaperone CopZ